ncbi:hypothetical protein QOZ80_6AG0515650 [Eleusine coracana subsp. coracana]|nr:hypothetical protein QOZ80_6AG0515650 [Eleusine coracana subsp. coracana]
MDAEGTMLNHLERMIDDENAEPIDLKLSLLEAITSNFSEDLKIGSGGFAAVYKGLLGNGKTVAVKKLYNTLDMKEKKYNEEGKMCDFGGKFVMADVRHRLLCFEYLPKGSIQKLINDASHDIEWRKRFQIVKGICYGLHYLHGKRIVHLDLKPSNILLDDNMEPKIVDFGISKCFHEEQSRAITSNLVGSMGYLAPESYDGVITLKSDIYSLGVIVQEILTGQKRISEMEEVVKSWSKKLGTSSSTNILLEQIRVCAKISNYCTDANPDKRPFTQNIIEMLDEAESDEEFIRTSASAQMAAKISPGYIDTELIDMYPTELCFPFEPNKYSRCPLSLSNRTDDEVVFLIIPKSPGSQIKDKGGEASKVSLMLRNLNRADEIVEPHVTPSFPLRIIGGLKSIDIHPKEPWILSGHAKSVCISRKNQQSNTYETFYTKPKKGGKKPRYLAVKFIEREQWAVSGDSSGRIDVYRNIDTFENVLTIHAHNNTIRSLAVHATQSYLLSSADDNIIKLWDWDNDWTCIRCFWRDLYPLHQVAFNPIDINSFASISGSSDRDAPASMKFWSIDSVDPITERRESGCQIACYMTGLDQQCMAIVDAGGNITILDVQSRTPLHTYKLAVDRNRSATIVACHPTIPLLVTGTNSGKDCGEVFLWNYRAYRLERVFKFEDEVRGFGFSDAEGSKRLVIGLSKTIETVEIN